MKLTKLVKKSAYKAFIGLFICFLIGNTIPFKAFADELGERYYMGYTGITQDNAFNYSSNGGASSHTDNLTGKQATQMWGVYYFPTTMYDIDYFGFKLHGYDSNTNEEFQPTCGNVRANNGATLDGIRMIKIDTFPINDISDVNGSLDYFNPYPTSGTTNPNIFDFQWNPNTQINGGKDSQAQNDGTCKYRYSAYYSAIDGTQQDPFMANDEELGHATIPAGHYVIMPMQAGPYYDTFEQTDPPYYDSDRTINFYGDYNKNAILGQMSYDSSPYGNDWIIQRAEFNDGLTQNLNWYLGKSDTIIINAEDNGKGYCNPFVNDISSAFINTSFSLSDCLSSVVKFLFVPSSDSMSQFSDLKSEIESKPPFGYISGIYNAINNVALDVENQAFTLESLGPINTLIFDPIRLGLTWILYFIFAFALFHRFKDINI